jgi:CspA family cold shock protein
MSDEEIFTGVCKHWNDDRGFCFIARPDGPDVFVHYRGIKNAMPLAVGERVAFVIRTDPKNGKRRTEGVERL